MARANHGEDELEYIMQLIWGFVPTHALSIAISIGIFEKIDERGAVCPEALSMDIGWDSYVLDALLELLARVELLSKSNDSYALTDLSKKWFLLSSEQYLGDFVKRGMHLESAYSDFVKYSSKGEAVPAMLNETMAAFGQDSVSTSAFVQSMHSMSLEFAYELEAAIDMSPYSTVLDVGAGKGTLSVVFAERNQWLTFDLLDLPIVADHARRYVENMGLSAKCSVFEGSWNDWDWGRKYDCILLSQVLHEMHTYESSQMIENCAKSLSHGGIVITVSTAPRDRMESKIGATFFLNMAVELGTQSPTVSWIKERFSTLGIDELLCLDLPGARVAWVGRKI